MPILVKKRDVWLNPPGATPQQLRFRTVTKLYNESPTWLIDAHRELDDAVISAYGWTQGVTDNEILSRLLSLNGQRFAADKAQGQLEFEPPRKVAKKGVRSVVQTTNIRKASKSEPK